MNQHTLFPVNTCNIELNRTYHRIDFYSHCWVLGRVMYLVRWKRFRVRVSWGLQISLHIFYPALEEDLTIIYLLKRDKTTRSLIYTTRQRSLHQDSCIYIKIHIYTSRFICIHQDLHIFIKCPIYTSRFVLLHQDLHKYIKIHICTSRFVCVH